MAAKYYTILTEIGKAKVANAAALGRQIKLTQIAVGDGNGNEYDPTEDQVALLGENYRTPISHIGNDPQNPNWVVAEGMIPVDVGGWFVREVGVFDEDGDLFAIGKYPETYKPTLSEGTGRDLYIRFIMVVSNTDTIDMKIDPTVEIATRTWVKEFSSVYLEEAFNKSDTSAEVSFIAHRGYSTYAPENTLSAYKEAGRRGFWGAECDCTVTSDGEWVLMHDDTVDRTTDGVGRVSDFTLAEIKLLDAGSWKHSKWSTERVPTVEEYLLECKRWNMVPVIEIKTSVSYSDPQLQALIDLCLHHFSNYAFVFISFSSSLLRRIRQMAPKVEMQYVVSTPTQTHVDFCVEMGRCGLDVNEGNVAIVDSLDLKGVYLNCWTVNGNESAKRCISHGVKQITTDFIVGA